LTIYQWFSLKIIGWFVSGSASEPLGWFFSDFASKQVATVFSGLTSKPVVIVSPGLVSKLVVDFLVEPQNESGGGLSGLGLKITATVSWFGPQNQVGYGLSLAPQK
jgi:hypothetical protein